MRAHSTLAPYALPHCTHCTPNVNPGLITPWLINRGVSPFRGDSDHFWREHPPNGTGLFILGQRLHVLLPVFRRFGTSQVRLLEATQCRPGHSEPGEATSSLFWASDASRRTWSRRCRGPKAVLVMQSAANWQDGIARQVLDVWILIPLYGLRRAVPCSVFSCFAERRVAGGVPTQNLQEACRLPRCAGFVCNTRWYRDRLQQRLMTLFFLLLLELN